MRNDDGIFAKYPIQTFFHHFHHYQSVASSTFFSATDQHNRAQDKKNKQ